MKIFSEFPLNKRLPFSKNHPQKKDNVINLHPFFSREFPKPLDPQIEIETTKPKYYAVTKFKESPTLGLISAQEKALKSSLLKDGLNFLPLAIYSKYSNQSISPVFEVRSQNQRLKSYQVRFKFYFNTFQRLEVLVELEDFQL